MAAAIGEESRDDEKVQNWNTKNKKHSENITCEHLNILNMNEMKNEK